MHSRQMTRLSASLAVLRVPHMRSPPRPRRIGSIVVLRMPAAPRTGPGTTAPPSGARRYNPGRRERSRRTQLPAVAAGKPPAVKPAPADRVHPGRAWTPGGTAVPARPRSASGLARPAGRESSRWTPPKEARKPVRRLRSAPPAARSARTRSASGRTARRARSPSRSTARAPSPGPPSSGPRAA